jgi:hypothetical protein
MASTVKLTIERTLMLSLALVFIARQFIHYEPLTMVQGSLVFLTIALLLPQLKGMTFWLSVSFLTIGVLLLLIEQAAPAYWFESAGVNVTLITLFLFAPLFGIPVRLPEYIEALNRFYETKVRHQSILFAGTQLLTQIMGVFLNVGSISVVYHVVFTKPRHGMSLLLANALNRGFAGAIFWSPYFAAMAVVISSLSLSWSALLPYMLGLSLLSFLVSLAVDYKQLNREEKTEPEEAEQAISEIQPVSTSSDSAFPIGLAVYLSTAIVVVLVLERLIDLPMVLITCLGAVLLPLIWCIVKGAMATYRQGLSNHITVTLPALKKEMTLFLAAGFFSGSMGTIGFGASLPGLLELFPLPISLTFSILTVVLITITSMIGLHPIVLVTILATGIDPAAVHISPEYLGVLLLGSWGLSNTVSPVSAVNNLLAALYKKPVTQFALPNYKFAACMAVILVAYLVVVGV